MWRWRALGCSGNRSTICWKATSNCGWSMPSTSKLLQDARPTSKMPSGLRICCSMGGSRPSFVPSRELRELRDLTRHRTSLIEERSRIINRLQKGLEDANIKLASVVSDLMGKSARAMVEALLQEEVDPSVLAQLALGRMRAKRDLLEQALTGRIKSHHRFLGSRAPRADRHLGCSDCPGKSTRSRSACALLN